MTSHSGKQGGKRLCSLTAKVCFVEIKMKTSFFKNCIVPHCINTSIKTPNKLFIRVPVNEKMRRKWLKLARRDDAHSLSTTSRMYFCEDHFDLPNEMLNYTEYHIMGKVSYVRMKPGCLPSKFDCQEDTRPYMIKKQTVATIAECLEENCIPSTSNELQQESCTPSTSIELQENFTPSTSLEQQPQTSSAGIQTIGENTPKVFKPTADKSIQVIITHKYKNKAIQTNVKTIDQKISPLKLSITSSSTSPFKVTTCKKSRPSSSTLKKITRSILIPEEQSDSDISLYTPSVPSASTNTTPDLNSEAEKANNKDEAKSLNI